MTHLLLACEGRSEKKSEELEEKKSTKGLYAFPALTGGAKEEPDLPLSHTPRDVVVQGKDWYALTREAVCGGTLQKNAHNLTLSLEPERKFLLKDLEQKGSPSIDKIFAADRTKIFGHLLVDVEERKGSIDLLVGFYYEKGLKDIVLGGPLLRFKEGNLAAMPEIEPEARVTGPIVKHKGKIYTVSHDTLRSSSGQDYQLEGGNILAVSINLDGIIALTNNNSQHWITTVGKNTDKSLQTPPAPEPEKLLDDLTILPSEATSVTIIDYERKKYVLFGLDDGMVSCYQLNPAAMKMEAVGVFNFLSPEERIHKGTIYDQDGNVLREGGKDDHIRHLQKYGFYLYFTMRNCAYGYEINSLMELLLQKGDTLEERIDHYGLQPSVSCRIPHRITKMELVL